MLMEGYMVRERIDFGKRFKGMNGLFDGLFVERRRWRDGRHGDPFSPCPVPPPLSSLSLPMVLDRIEEAMLDEVNK
jgi:hypothetical protein